jgi:hypothetical protein
MIITTVGRIILNGQHVQRAVSHQAMWPFRDQYQELSSALREIIWSDPSADPARHCCLDAQMMYPNEELSLFTMLQDKNRLIGDCGFISRKGILLSNQLLVPFLNNGQLHIFFQRGDLLISHYNPPILISEKISINLSLVGGTFNTTETGILIDVDPLMNYEDFVNVILEHPLFQERFPSVHGRLRAQGYHLPGILNCITSLLISRQNCLKY